MSRLLVDLFAEDRAHEEFLTPLVKRISSEDGPRAQVRVISAEGGHGRALEEFRVYQRSLMRAVVPAPDVVVVAIEGNFQPWSQARQQILEAVDPGLAVAVVVACPDPHIERWYVADPGSFHALVGASPAAGRTKCERDHYKAVRRDAVRKGGYVPTLGGIEFARKEALNDRRASLDPDAEVRPAMHAYVKEEFKKGASTLPEFFPKDSSAVANTARLTMVVVEPEIAWTDAGAVRAQISDWTRLRGEPRATIPRPSYGVSRNRGASCTRKSSWPSPGRGSSATSVAESWARTLTPPPPPAPRANSASSSTTSASPARSESNRSHPPGQFLFPLFSAP